MILPALNEAESLPAVFADLHTLSLNLRVVLVDNGSTDGTDEVGRSFGINVIHEPRRGYGTAVLAGMNWLANHPDGPPDIVVILDGDHADDPCRLPDLLAPILDDRADFVLTDRTLTAEPGALSTVQIFGNALSTRLIHRFTGHRFRDMGPLRALTWPALMNLRMEDPTWGWNVEMQMKAVQQGLRILEIPLPYRCRRAGESKIGGSLKGSVRAGVRILQAVNRYR